MHRDRTRVLAKSQQDALKTRPPPKMAAPRCLLLCNDVLIGEVEWLDESGKLFALFISFT
jgi:hypothetical protein